MLERVLRIHKETVHVAYGTKFILIALRQQNKKSYRNSFANERWEKGTTASAEFGSQVIKQRSPNPLGQKAASCLLSEQVSLQHIASFEMKGNIKRPWRVVMDKEISSSQVNDNTLLNLPLCLQATLS